MNITFEFATQQLQSTSADKQVVELLSATKGFQEPKIEQLSAKQLIAVGQELGLSEPSVRMALSRQTKAGKLVRNDGLYSIAKQQNPYSLPRFWLQSSKRTHEWQKDWLLIHSLSGKPDTTTSRRLGKCAQMLGLMLIPSLGYIRPNNLDDLAQEVVYHFNQVAPNSQWLSAYLLDVDDTTLNYWEQLWPTDELNRSYNQAVAFIQQEQQILCSLSPRCVLNRSFACGRLLVELLSNDPWLPGLWVDETKRQELIEHTLAYYQAIKPSWLEVLDKQFA